MSLQQPLKGTTKRKNVEEDEEDKEIVNVDFDFFNIDEIDYHAIKHLLVQLFHSDAEHLELHTLTDLILQQNHIGSTIKVDGKESDPYAFLTAIGINKNKENSAVEKMSNYLLNRAKSSSNQTLHSTLSQLLSDSSSNIALLLGERLVNMPVVLIPHMLRFLLEELETASQEDSTYKYTHFLIPTRTYIEQDNDVDMDDEAPAKKKRGGGSSKLQTFHPEDDMTQDFTDLVADYQYQHVVTREQDAFGADVRGRLILIEAKTFKDQVLPRMIQVTTEAAGL
ncbi:hypothetical protein E3P99_00729 [Wallemia hederae]|uniref:Protein BCP1 n=1 Tax=Wallemia hederae TaxID=1540922 RepID=A0A4T0FYI7_9BASI|nr:hypothetical protein E3P99_00729 [Wallemia hederae]